MGSIDIPRFVRDKMKEQIQNGKKQPESNVPSFVKKKDETVSEDIAQPSPTGTENIPQSPSPLPSENGAARPIVDFREGLKFQEPDQSKKPAIYSIAELAKKQNDDDNIILASVIPQNFPESQPNNIIAENTKNSKEKDVLAGNPDAITSVIQREQQKLDKQTRQAKANLSGIQKAESYGAQGGELYDKSVELRAEVESLQATRVKLLNDGIETINKIYAKKFEDSPDKSVVVQNQLGDELRNHQAKIGGDLLYADEKSVADKLPDYEKVMTAPGATFSPIKNVLQQRLDLVKKTNQQLEFTNRAVLLNATYENSFEQLQDLSKDPQVQQGLSGTTEQQAELADNPKVQQAKKLIDDFRATGAQMDNLVNQYPEIKAQRQSQQVADLYADYIVRAEKGEYGVGEKLIAERNLVEGKRLNSDFEIKRIVDASKGTLTEDEVRKYASNAAIPSFVGNFLRGFGSSFLDTQQGINRLVLPKTQADIQNKVIENSKYHAPEALQGFSNVNNILSAMFSGTGNVVGLAAQGAVLGEAVGVVSGLSKLARLSKTALNALQTAEQVLPTTKLADFMVTLGTAETREQALGQLLSSANKAKNMAGVYGSVYLPSYEGAYQEAAKHTADEGKRNEYASEVANANGVAMLFLNPPSLVGKIVNPVPFGTKEVFKSQLEHVGKTLVSAAPATMIPLVQETISKDDIFDYHTSASTFINESLDRTLHMAVSVLPLGILGAARIPSSKMLKSSLYEAGKQREQMNERVEELFNKGEITNEEKNRQISVINTLSNLVHNTPEKNNEGKELTQEQKNDLVYLQLQNSDLRAKQEKVTEDVAPHYEQEIKENTSAIKEIMQPKEEKAAEVTQPEVVSNEKEIPKSTRQSEARKVYKDIGEIDEPTDARGMALAYLAGGNKINESSINEIAGTVKRASLNTGAKERKTSEVKARDYASKDAPTIDEAAHSIWDNLPEDLQNNISTQDIKNELNDVVNSHNTRLSAATEFRDRYIIGDSKHNLAEAEAKEINDIQLDKLKDITSELPEIQQEELVKLLANYQGKSGLVDWEKLETDIKGFTPDVLSLPTETQKALDGLVEEHIKSGQIESPIANDKGISTKETGQDKINSPQREGRIKAAQTAYDKAVTDLQKAEEKISKKQSTQGSLLPSEGTQEEMFGVNRDEAKSILDPLRQKVKEAKSELDAAHNQGDVAEGQPELTDVTKPISINVSEEKSSQDSQEGRQESSQESGGEESNVGEQPIADNQGGDTGIPPPFIPPRVPSFSESETSKERIRGAYKHLMDSKIPENVKEKFRENGITYKVSDNGEAQAAGKAVISAFGTEEALKLARQRTFHPSVNSAVYSEAINDFYNKEQAAKTPKEKFVNAARWASTYNEYAELLTATGQFGQYSYQFYKTSKLGFILSAKERLDERREHFLAKDEKSLKQAFEELKDLPEFQEIFSKEVQEAAKKSKNEIKKEVRKKISDAFDKLKLDKNATYVTFVPPQIINGAIEAMKQAVLLGYEVVDVIAEGVKYINTRHKEGWNQEKFENDFTPTIEGFISENTTKRPSASQQKKILDKWDKKLTKLDPEKRKELLSKVLNEIVQNNGLEYDKFKQMYADALGLPSLTPEMETKLNDLGGKLNNVDIAKDKLDADQTKENVDGFLKATNEGEKASRQLNDLLGEKGITLDRFLSIAKLNTLGVANLIVNPFFNVWFMPIRFLESMVKTGLDYGLKYVGFSRSDGIYENTFYKQRGYIKGFGIGLKKSVINLYTGDQQFDYFQKKTRQNIQPIESAKEILAHYKGGKQLTTPELANAMMEAFPTMGMSAAIISRGLQVGDLPFRFAAERGTAENIATQKGLSGIKKEAFILNPDEASKEKITDSGERAVMAQDNLLTGALNRLSSYLKYETQGSKARQALVGAGKVVGATTQPFLKIPLNSAMTTFELAVPEFAILRGLYHATTGNRDLALNAFSRAIVGYSISLALNQMAKAGLVTGTDSDKDKVNASIYKGDYVGDNTINFTGFKRWLRGGNSQFEDGDVTMSLNWLGVPGAIMQMQAQRFDKMPPEQWDKEGYFPNLWERMNGSFVNGLKNNVFGNTSTLFNAMDGGSPYYVNRWLRGSSNVLMNSFDPQWLSTASRISDKYKPDYSAMNLGQQMSATLKERFWNGDNLPKQITVWGQKRTDAPKGTDPVLYYYGDITKSRNVDTKDFGFNVLGLYNRTKDDGVIPSRPQKTIRNKNESIHLSPDEYQDFQIMVGSNRKQLVQALMNTTGYNQADDEIKIKMLKNQYENGFQLGKREFQFKNPNLFKPQKK